MEPDNIAKGIGIASLVVGALFIVPQYLGFWVDYADCQQLRMAEAKKGHLMSCSDIRAKMQKAESAASRPAP